MNKTFLLPAIDTINVKIEVIMLLERHNLASQTKKPTFLLRCLTKEFTGEGEVTLGSASHLEISTLHLSLSKEQEFYSYRVI